MMKENKTAEKYTRKEDKDEKKDKQEEDVMKKVNEVNLKMEDFSMMTYGVQETLISNPDDLVRFNYKTGKAEVVGKDPRKNKDHI